MRSYAVLTFLSALLLFMVQPLMARAVLRQHPGGCHGKYTGGDRIEKHFATAHENSPLVSLTLSGVHVAVSTCLGGRFADRVWLSIRDGLRTVSESFRL